MYEAAAAPAAAVPAMRRRNGRRAALRAGSRPDVLAFMPVMVPRRGGAVVWLRAKMDARRLTPDGQRWLACAADMAVAGKAAAAPLYGTAAGRESLGVGAGGDDTLEIDQACEVAIRQVLAEEAPAPYRLVSEEAGIVGPAEAPWTVVVDPVDGSLNAKHGLQPFGASIAIAHGGHAGRSRRRARRRLRASPGVRGRERSRADPGGGRAALRERPGGDIVAGGGAPGPSPL